MFNASHTCNVMGNIHSEYLKTDAHFSDLPKL